MLTVNATVIADLSLDKRFLLLNEFLHTSLIESI